MQVWLVLVLVAGRWGPTANLQSAELEQVVAVQALADELKSRPAGGFTLVYRELTAETKGAATFDTWLATLLPQHVRARVSDELFRSYWTVNKKQRALNRFREVDGVPVRFVTQRGEESLPAKGGVFAVSRVGLSAQGDSALVSVSFYCRGLCGSQKLYLYVLRDGRWRQQQTLRWLVSQLIAPPNPIKRDWRKRADSY